ncbi:MAG: hypothetical protein P8Z79_20925, partial [Sedimentisphaerales bacterium]
SHPAGIATKHALSTVEWGAKDYEGLMLVGGRIRFRRGKELAWSKITCVQFALNQNRWTDSVPLATG